MKKRLNTLKYYIYKSGKSGRVVGLDARIPETKLSAIINGKIKPSTEEKKQLSKVLGVKEAILFGDLK